MMRTITFGTRRTIAIQEPRRSIDIVRAERTVVVSDVERTVTFTRPSRRLTVTRITRAPAAFVRPVRTVTVVQGRAGRDGNDGLGSTYRFEFNSITILPLVRIEAGRAVRAVEVCILTPFDGAGASLSVGDDAQHDRLMSASEIDPAVKATFGTFPGYAYTELTLLNLYIAPGSGATAGSGIVVLYLE